MPDLPNQLDEIYRQLGEDFSSHPLISVTPIKGDPPEQYEIIYTINGMCKTGEGSIVEKTDHTVEITIPFGFPHFPPSCKPKSDLFHPDFDPAAICLGDFWEQHRSLSELIIYIGKMINGELFSTTNAFNEDAAEWYQENSNRFPIRQLNWDVINNGNVAPGDLSSEIDTLDDADLTTEFDFLSLESDGDEEDIILNTSFPEVDVSTDIDIELFKQLERQKKYYALLRTGEALSSSSSELNQLCQNARKNIQEAERLHREAKNLESKGNAKTALGKYQLITKIIADFPVIESDIQRVKQTLALLEDITSDEPEEPHPAEKVQPISLAEPKTKSSKKPPAKVEKRAQPEKSVREKDNIVTRKSSHYKIYLLIGLLVIASGIGGYFWFSFSSRLNSAEEAYAECSTAFANSKFTVAKSSCDNALQLLGGVMFIQQDFVRQLERFILEILQSEKLAQGLAGKVLFDGKYIPKTQIETLQTINQKRSDADALFVDGKWQAAMKLYQELLTEAATNSFIDQLNLEDINRKYFISQFRNSYDPAKAAMLKSQWEIAIEHLLRAQKILVSLPKNDREQYSEQLQIALQESQFANLKEQGDMSFTSSDWLSAIDSYNLALTRGQEASLSPESIDAIRNNIKRAELYTAIYEGNKFFAAGSWDSAIAAYTKASNLLVSSKRIPYEKGSDINIQKLARIILKASIIRDRQSAQALFESNELEKARSGYQQIITSIQKSSFNRDEEFATILQEIEKTVQSLDQEILLGQQKDYLKENYLSLFMSNYPSSIPEGLINPVISKVKETDAELVFRMQCTDIGGGRPLTLVMHYAYNKKSGKWAPHSGQ